MASQKLLAARVANLEALGEYMRNEAASLRAEAERLSGGGTRKGRRAAAAKHTAVIVGRVLGNFRASLARKSQRLQANQ